MSDGHGTRVLVAGGGIGGLTCAIALLKAGLRPVVLERHPAPADAGAGISLWPNAVHALRALGLGDALTAIGQESTGGALRLSDGRVLTRLPGVEVAERFGAPLLVVHRAELIARLRAALPPGVLRDGALVTDVTADAAGVAVTLGDGERLEGALVVGADGVRSLVRDRLWSDPPAAPGGVVAWRGVVPRGAELAALEGETWGSGLLFGAAGLPDQRVYWFAACAAPEQGEPDAVREHQALVARLRDWAVPAAELVARTDPDAVIRTPLMERAVAAPLARGRAALLGDAAHPMLPNIGQGGCQAIEDAVELAAALGGEPDVAAALARYDSARSGRVTKVVARSRRTGQAALLRSPVLAGARNVALRLTPPSAALRSLAPIVGHRAQTP